MSVDVKQGPTHWHPDSLELSPLRRHNRIIETARNNVLRYQILQ